MKLISRLQVSILFFFALVSLFGGISPAFADPLASRSVRIGDGNPAVTTSHTFSFTIPNADNIGSIEFEYCSNSPFVGTACTQPNGLDVSASTLANQTGETGFSIDVVNTTANRLVITRPAAMNLAGQAVSYRFNGVLNPSDNNTTTFVRISLFASADATGPRSDYGSVAFAVTSTLSVEAFVPPYLTFCAAITVASKCTVTSGDFIQLGELSKSSAKTATSQFSGATNDPGGYSVFVDGTTLTSGTNIIDPLTTRKSSSPGTSQFGINLVANSNPGVGKNPQGSSTSFAQPRTDYKQTNQFKFDNEIIASSPSSTNYTTMTVSYLVNVSPNQKAGIYTSTLTYVATAAF